MVKFTKKHDPFASREAQKYEFPIPSREYIIEYLSERGCPATYQDLQTEFELNHSEEQEALRRRLIAMVRDGQLLKNRKGAYGPLASMELIAGRVIGHKDGFGFLKPDEGDEDLFLSPRQMRSVFHGDRVLARVAKIDTRGRREAVIVEVLERQTQQLVGRYYLESGIAYVEPANRRITQDILIPSDAKQSAEHGQMVIVAVTAQPDKHARPLGEIIEILGDHMAPGMEVNVAIRNHDLPYQWPDDVLQEATLFPKEVVDTDLNDRKDLCALPFVTIDGEDAKDFDDAVFCKPREKGGWILYVAIADVSYYVRPGSMLDQEASKRGNSVYFPGRVIPMLPEQLSNHLCSLKPLVKRLAMVCEMTIASNGELLSYQFMEAVICSHARLTYRDVYLMMEQQDEQKRAQFAALVPYLSHLYDLFHVLHDLRIERGAIDFDLPETKIVFGKDRKIEKIVPYERYLSHRVIEEAMLSANICAARFLEKNKQLGLYRVHEGPTKEKLNDLKRFLKEMGLTMSKPHAPTPADYANLLRAVKDRPDAHMIQTILLRSMSQAIYNPDNKGHFGLAYEAYTHFTSPIRRYPDLIVHRAIKQILSRKVLQWDENTLVKIAEHCSMTERRADDATNEAKDWLKCEFMMDKVGQVFPGIISGVMHFGLFVELNDIYVEGLAHVSTLPNDYYQFDAVRHLLFSERTGRQFRLGDPVMVQVARVDLDECEIDFVLAGVEKNNKKEKKPAKHSKKRKVNRGKRQKK